MKKVTQLVSPLLFSAIIISINGTITAGESDRELESSLIIQNNKFISHNQYSAANQGTLTNNQDGTGDINSYHLVWQDLFDGNSLNESENWSIEVNGNGGGNNELQYYRNENITIEKEPISNNNCLVITARKEQYGGKSVTSGRLTTQKKMSFKFGKVEARIKLPKTANGLWPAFWLLGNDISTVGWPKCGEIDIMEMGNVNGIKYNTQDRYFNGACHWGYYENGWYPNYAKSTTNDYSLQDEFHLFTMIWDKEYIKMYLDMDKYPNVSPYYEMNISSFADSKSPGYYFQKQFFIILNLAVGGNFPAIWNINNVTALSNNDAKMYIDYVKVYQKGNSDEEFSGKSTNIPSITSSNQAQVNYDAISKVANINGNVMLLSVFSLNGSEIKNVHGSNSICLSDLKSGVYIIRAIMNDKSLVKCKISVK